MTKVVEEQFIFVIDTDAYAGNFERGLCAYITGRLGECEVGEDEAEIFREEVGDPDELFEFIDSKPDEDGGCLRPVTIFPTPGWFNDGRGGHFREGEEEKAQEHKKTSPEWKGEENTPLLKWPCCNSVAIFFSKNDCDGFSEDKLRIMEERAIKFFKVFPDTEANIEGIRILKDTTTREVMEEKTFKTS